MSIEERWQQRFQNFEKAFQKLHEAVDKGEYSDLERAGLIQTFEFTFELAWKTLKDILEFEGFEVKSPRETIKQAFQAGYIKDGAGWLDVLEKRNLMSHTYDDEVSEEVAELIQEHYYFLMAELSKTLNEKLAE
jgi:nucleotidyltransferase substrate binding protein (TIGR01987 family)